MVLNSQKLREPVCKYKKSRDGTGNSNFLSFRQIDPFGELFSEILLKISSEFKFFWNLGEYEIPADRERWPMELTQNRAFSVAQKTNIKTFLDFIFKSLPSTPWPFFVLNIALVFYFRSLSLFLKPIKTDPVMKLSSVTHFIKLAQ